MSNRLTNAQGGIRLFGLKGNGGEVRIIGLTGGFGSGKSTVAGFLAKLGAAVINADEGNLSPTECAVAKAFTNDAAFWVAHEALQVMGGYGYSTEFPLEYILRRVRGWMIGGGTGEMMKNRIAEGIFNRHFSQRPPKPQ